MLRGVLAFFEALSRLFDFLQRRQDRADGARDERDRQRREQEDEARRQAEIDARSDDVRDNRVDTWLRGDGAAAASQDLPGVSGAFASGKIFAGRPENPGLADPGVPSRVSGLARPPSGPSR